MLHCADGLASILEGASNSSILPAAFVLRRKHHGCANAAGLAGRPNPFCGSVAESQNHASLTLFCETGVIDELPLALYGTPSGSSCLESVADSSCNDGTYLAYAQATCLGFPYCVLKPQDRRDPCPGKLSGTLVLDFSPTSNDERLEPPTASGTVKRIVAVAHCSLEPGGWAAMH